MNEILIIALVTFTALNGQTVRINPREVVLIREVGKGQVLTSAAQCVIGTTDSKFITVREHCDDVQRKLKGQ